MECHICSFPFWYLSLDMLQLETSTASSFWQEMLQSRVQPSNITFSILVKLHFEAATVVFSFLGFRKPNKNGTFSLLEVLDIPKQKACKCTKSEGYYGSEEWMMSLWEQMCSSISRHVVSFTNCHLSHVRANLAQVGQIAEAFRLVPTPPTVLYPLKLLKKAMLWQKAMLSRRISPSAVQGI